MRVRPYQSVRNGADGHPQSPMLVACLANCRFEIALLTSVEKRRGEGGVASGVSRSVFFPQSQGKYRCGWQLEIILRLIGISEKLRECG